METARARIIQFIEKQGIEPKKFLEKTGLKKGFVDKSHISSSASDVYLSKILDSYPELSAEWLLMGKGEMLKTKSKENLINLDDKENDKENDNKPNVKKNLSLEEKNGTRPPLTPEKLKELQDIADGKYLKPKLIPVYGVSTIGGTQLDADMSPVSEPESYVEAGGWFPSISAAIYHYGESMKEYPNGCLLALQEVYNQHTILWGNNYVIETNEMRITKRLQTCPDDKNCVMAYSSNTETYPDGRLIHEPIIINKEDIKKLFLVVGIIIKNQMSAPIMIKKK